MAQPTGLHTQAPGGLRHLGSCDGWIAFSEGLRWHRLAGAWGMKPGGLCHLSPSLALAGGALPPVDSPFRVGAGRL